MEVGAVMKVCPYVFNPIVFFTFLLLLFAYFDVMSIIYDLNSAKIM